MTCHSLGFFLKSRERALERYLSTPLRPMNLRELSAGDRQYIHTAVEQLAARTARCYRAICSDVLGRSLDRETAARLLPLESICKREFESCVALKKTAEMYFGQLERGEIGDLDTFQSHEVGDGECMDGMLKGDEDDAREGGSSGTQFIDILENLCSRENVLDIVVNEESIRSPDLNNWLLCFCRRRVSWRVIHGHLLHLVEPKRYSPIIREDRSIGGILKQATTVVVELYSRVAQAAHGGSMTVNVEERPDLLTRPPSGHLATSSEKRDPAAPSTATPAAPFSGMIYSVEGHLEYVFRELIKNACLAMLSKTASINLNVHFASCDTHVVVDVMDTGGGISPEAVENLWLFGWTTNYLLGNPMGGFGVGLPASKVYMDLWGGRIDMYTTAGVGTTVRVVLPKAPTEVLVPRRRRLPFALV